jgi:hypothetical protein
MDLPEYQAAAANWVPQYAAAPPAGSIPTGHPGIWITPSGNTWTAQGVGGGTMEDYSRMMRQAFGSSFGDPGGAYNVLSRALSGPGGEGSVSAQQFEQYQNDPAAFHAWRRRVLGY